MSLNVCTPISDFSFFIFHSKNTLWHTGERSIGERYLNVQSGLRSQRRFEEGVQEGNSGDSERDRCSGGEESTSQKTESPAFAVFQPEGGHSFWDYRVATWRLANLRQQLEKKQTALKERRSIRFPCLLLCSTNSHSLLNSLLSSTARLNFLWEWN